LYSKEEEEELLKHKEREKNLRFKGVFHDFLLNKAINVH